MAIKIFYIRAVNAVAPNWFSILQETAPAVGVTTYGWICAKLSTATPYWRARLGATALTTNTAAPVSASSHIESAVIPLKGTGASTSTAGDSFISPTPYTGIFAAGNWVFNWHFRVTAVSLSGRVRFNVYRSANADGTGATKINSFTLIGSTITLSATATTYNSTYTWAAPEITLNNEYLFFQVE